MRSVHHPEEVDEPLAGHGLVADHQGTVQDHLLLEYWRNLEKENIYFFNRYHQQQNKWYLQRFFPAHFDDRYCSRLSYLIEDLPPLNGPRFVPQKERNVPEADVGALESFSHEFKPFPPFDFLLQVLGGTEGRIDAPFKHIQTVNLNRQPQLERVPLPTTLDALVAGVVGHVVELVLLEEVSGATAVGLVE